MKLLIVTQTVDIKDPVLGFFHAWIEEFARRCKQVTVICLNEGTHNLPNNVRVLSLGKESVTPPRPVGEGWGEGAAGSRGVTPGDSLPYNLQPATCNLVTRARYLFRFYSYIWHERTNYEAVFVHMNPEYVVLGAPLWRLMSKKVSLWYTHKSVTPWLRVAAHFAHTIFTASKESFRITSPKVHVVGHGIDVGVFHSAGSSKQEAHISRKGLRLVAVGRISRTKRQDLAIEALALVRARGLPATLTLIGTPLTDADRVYEAELRRRIADNSLGDCVVWVGAVQNVNLPTYLANADILVHTSETGSLDKVVLEALAAGLLLVTTSDPVRIVLPSELGEAGYTTSMPESLADRIITLAKRADAPSLRTLGRTYVEANHALPALITRILDTIW